ncbi:MAG TPA: OsmC family protein [Levilinea sp.]|nr:OsmC family protein [Levilinea sp.]
MSTMNASVTWQQRMTFTGTAGSGLTVPLGTTPDVGGDNDGFKPIELLLVSLAGCTAMDVISILQKKRQDVRAFNVQVHGERGEDHPKVFTLITVEYIVKGKNIDKTSVERAVQLSTEKYCAVQAMLGKDVPIEHKIVIEEE